MKKLYSGLCLGILGMLILPSVAGAYNSWGLTGVDYTSRSARGADETRRYSSRQEYQKILTQFTGSVDEEPTQAEKNRKTATDYVLEFFAKEFSIRAVLKKEGKQQLFWPLQYAKKKTKILVHHTATNGTLPKTIEQEKQFMKDVYKYHAFSRGWGDIGYNFIIMPSGRIYEGRKGGAGVVGAHATWNNTPSIGVSLVGNFETNEPEQAQVTALVTIVTALAKRFSIDPSQQSYYFKTSSKYPYVAIEKHASIAGHKDAGVTACPGKNLYALLPNIREVVVDRIAANSTQGVVYVQHADILPTSGNSLEAIKSSYVAANDISLSKATIQRLTKAPLSQDISDIQKTLVRVLLYDASTTRNTRTLSCSPICSVRIGNTTRMSPTVSVAKTTDGFALLLGKRKYLASKFAVLAGTTGTIAITNYDRVASNKTPLNIFRQTLLFVTAPLQQIDGSISSTQHIINIVSFDNYMRGIAEASDEEDQKKTNVLALLTKGYALYYLGGSFKHPSIPIGALYNAIDDPRLFQKYLGQGRETISKNRPKALDAMQNTYITYNNVLPILPYFHCSAGFTWAASDKRGWRDTPYLQSVFDTSGKCESGDFEGHGVGLSGKGAAAMANAGKSEKEILQYYYPGVELTTVQ